MFGGFGVKAPQWFNPQAALSGPVIIGGPVDPASSFGINLNSGIPITTGENPAVSFVGAPATIFRMVWDTFAQQTGFIFRRADGTLQNPQPLAQGDVIFNFTSRGFRGDRYTTGSEGSATFESWAAENWSPTATGGLLAWRTTTVGQTGPGNSLYRMALYQGLAIGTQSSPLSLVDPGPGSLSVANNAIVGFTSALAVNSTPVVPVLQVHGINANGAAFSVTRWSADANSPQEYQAKSRGASINTRGAVQSGDNCFTFFGMGDDGTNFIACGRFQMQVDGAVSTGIVPGRMVFATGTSAGSVSEALRLDSTQIAIFANFLRVNQAPTANTSASTTITNGADSASNLGHRFTFNLNGTTYWVPCGSVAF